MPESSSKIVIGIESSCDETGIAIIRADNKGHKEILSNLVLSQLKEHKVFGGVVPEIAARAHMNHIDTLIKAAMDEAKIGFSDLDAVASTIGPGLIGGVMVGMMAGKSIAAAHDIPFIGINHLEAHVLTPRLTDIVKFPYLVLLVSGGHTQILIAEDVGQYVRLGTTIDDALGECFDKSAKLMGLPYPGGPNVEKMAAQCRDQQKALKHFPLPSPMKGREGCDFSFSGLKTAVRQAVEKLPGDELKKDDIADLAFALQYTIGDILIDRCHNAIKEFKKKNNTGHFIACGGVAANQYIRKTLQELTTQQNMDFMAPPLELCSDNGAMIAWAGYEKLMKNDISTLDVAARPRWPLDPNAVAKPGGGVKA